MIVAPCSPSSSMIVSPNSYASLEADTQELKRITQQHIKVRNQHIIFNTKIQNSAKSIDSILKCQATIVNLQEKRKVFFKKYVENRWYQVAVVILGLATITLGAFAIYKAVTLTTAWLNAPPARPGAYSNLDRLIFYSFISFGTVFAAALAIPAIPIALGGASIILGLWLVFAPKSVLASFAPDPKNHQRQLNKTLYPELQRLLDLDQDGINTLLNLWLEKAKAHEQTSSEPLTTDDLQDFLLEHVPNFQTTRTQLQQEYRELLPRTLIDTDED